MTALQVAAPAALGSIGKFASAPAHTRKNSSPFSEPGTPERLLSTDTKYKLQRAAGRLLPLEAVASCGRVCIGSEGVQVVRDASGRAYTRGLSRCSNVWHCPICAAKIIEQRRQNLVQLLKNFRAEGGHVAMMTLTLPHHVHQPLKVVKAALLEAFRKFNSGRTRLNTILEDADYVGLVRALEVTHGFENGWHPHLHILIFTRRQLVAADIERLRSLWCASIARQGFASIRPDVACQVQNGASAAEYVSKGGWGMAEEITKATVKKGQGGRNPLQLLERAALGCVESGKLFQEYALEFKGNKQMFMSPAVKSIMDDYKLDQKEDSEITQEENIEVEEVVGRVANCDWALIYRFELRAELLNRVEQSGADGLHEVVEIARLLRKAGLRDLEHITA